MRTNYVRMHEIGLAIGVSSLVLLVFTPGSMGDQGDWNIWHNWENVAVGGYCSIIAGSGVNYVEGTFEWVSGDDPGITFVYTYDPDEEWFEAPAAWSSPNYVFDFSTDWPYDYSGIFKILPSVGDDYEYWCTTPRS